MPSEKAIVLTSGGLNSAVALSLAVKEHPVSVLHVRFGHRAEEREAEMFERQADHYEIRDRLVVEMPHFATIGGNGRVARKIQIEDALAMRETVSNSCYVPGLIGGLVHAAYGWAYTLGATKIYLGISEDLGPPAPKTSSIFPDYSRECVQLCNHLMSVVAATHPITVEAPLIDLTRSDIVKLGRRLETPFDKTWSCISSGTQCCGACVGCATRNRGFLDAAIPDPIYLQAAVRV